MGSFLKVGGLISVQSVREKGEVGVYNFLWGRVHVTKETGIERRRGLGRETRAYDLRSVDDFDERMLILSLRKGLGYFCCEMTH